MRVSACRAPLVGQAQLLAVGDRSRANVGKPVGRQHRLRERSRTSCAVEMEGGQRDVGNLQAQRQSRLDPDLHCCDFGKFEMGGDEAVQNDVQPCSIFIDCL